MAITLIQLGVLLAGRRGIARLLRRRVIAHTIAVQQKRLGLREHAKAFANPGRTDGVKHLRVIPEPLSRGWLRRITRASRYSFLINLSGRTP